MGQHQSAHSKGASLRRHSLPDNAKETIQAEISHDPSPDTQSEEPRPNWVMLSDDEAAEATPPVATPLAPAQPVRVPDVPRAPMSPTTRKADWVDLSDDESLIDSPKACRKTISSQPSYSTRYDGGSDSGSSSSGGIGTLTSSLSVGSPGDGFLSESSITELMANNTTSQPPHLMSRASPTYGPATTGCDAAAIATNVEIEAFLASRPDAEAAVESVAAVLPGAGTFEIVQALKANNSDWERATKQLLKQRPSSNTITTSSDLRASRPSRRRSRDTRPPIGLRQLAAAEPMHTQRGFALHGARHSSMDERWEMVSDEKDDLDKHYRHYVDRMRAAETVDRSLRHQDSAPQVVERSPVQAERGERSSSISQRLWSGLGFPPASPYEKSYWSD